MINKKLNILNKIRFTSLIVLVFLILVKIYFYIHQTPTITPNLNDKIKSTYQINKCKFIRKLDGVCVTKKENTNIWPVAIMIDNHPDAWPQFGISKANLVYNTLVEGGTTRLMAFFATNKNIKKIGPVRSSRPYFLTLAKELDALYAHSGGSPDALQKIKDWKILNLEEITFYGPIYFWRDHKKLAPHNLFTSSEKINEARKDWQLATSTPTYTNWKFSSYDKTKKFNFPNITKISIQYSSNSHFNISYLYSTSTQRYLRFQNKNPYIDAIDNSQIQTKNLIIQFVPKEKHLDFKDRLSIETIGSNKAWVFFNGQIIKGKWIKKKLENRTIFYNFNNKEIIFPPGNIWIEIVPGEKKVKITK